MDFEQTLEKYRNIIDSRIEGLFDKKIEYSTGFIRSSYAYLKEFLLRGGKRLRSILTVMAYKSLCDLDENRIFLPAVGIELFHNSSLIHDDIMDEDGERRGKPSMHKHFEGVFLSDYEEKRYNGGIFSKMSERFGVSIAILQGDILYALTESCFTGSSFEADINLKALDVINQTYRKISEGQILDILSEVKTDFNEVECLEVVEKKTAFLFKAATQVGAIYSRATAKQTEALSRYALSIGKAFQLQDDLLDICPGLKGHALGSDIKRGKRTLLMIKALENANEKQQQILLAAFGNYRADREQILAASDVLQKTGAVDYVKGLARQKLRDGQSSLDAAELTKEGLAFFMGLVDYMTNRNI